jgi:cytochrome bd-type quinol oxidase subunit 2
MTSPVKIVKSSIASVAIVALTAPLAFAQATGGVPVTSNYSDKGIPFGFSDVPTLINTIFKIVIAAAGAIFILMFLFGGIQYLTSAGNEEGSTKARKLLVDAVVGLMIVLAAYAIGSWVLGQVGLGSNTSRGTF